jgi:general stress protein YciG
MSPALSGVVLDTVRRPAIADSGKEIGRWRGPPSRSRAHSHPPALKAECIHAMCSLLRHGNSCLVAETLFPSVDIWNATFKEKARADLWMSPACMRGAWYSTAMKKRLTITEFARMGGKARAQKLSAERRRQIASEAGKKGGRPRKAKVDSAT